MLFNRCAAHHNPFQLASAVVVAIAASCWPGRVEADTFVLARDGKPTATIVTATATSDAAAFAAEELQYHVQKITGATLPIKSDAEKVEGPRVLVGPGAATAQLGLEPGQLKDQEYLIRFVGDTLILLGKDAPTRTNVEKAKTWPAPAGGTRIPPPLWYEGQSTSCAVHDFLERFCDVRWYGPVDSQMTFLKSATLAIQPQEVRRSPAFIYRTGFVQEPYSRIARDLYDHPTMADMALFWARLRLGGESYLCTHSFEGYYDRFWEKNPQHPEVFVASHPEWFAQGYPKDSPCCDHGKPPQMCYSNQGFIDQVVADARKFFDNPRSVPCREGAGNYFNLVPMDNNFYCRCPACRAQLTPERNDQEFSNGMASDYFFTFANKVARVVAKTHPGKYLATLAYYDYAYHPCKVRLEPNISVQMCMHVRHWWAPGMKENDLRFYRDWVSHEKGRPLFTWDYYCFPDLFCLDGTWECFPGFSAHTLDRQIKMYARDGLHGPYLGTFGEQVDAYLSFKLMDDPLLNVDALLEEFFTRYYGAAAGPMKRFYLRVEDIYSTTANYPEEVRKDHYKQFHQTEEIAWKYLGTETRMAELGAMMDEATRSAASEVEKQRVALFRKAVWDRMVGGRRQYLAKQQKRL